MSSDEYLREKQFAVGLSPRQLLRLLGSHEVHWRPATLRRVFQVLHVGLLAAAARRRPATHETDPTVRPVFIVGHWRSGTSALQRLLACDRRFRTPSYLECAFPHATDGLAAWFTGHMSKKLPATRGFDAFPLGLEAEFEDEFALFKLTLDSPLLAYLFPAQARETWQAFFAQPASPAWRDAMHAFACRLAPAQGWLLLKSPTHAWRMDVLSRMFTEARFVNIVRDPVEVFLSSCALERYLLENNSLQSGSCEPDEALVLHRQAEHVRAVAAAKSLLPDDRFFELSFEQLHDEPAQRLQALCEALKLGDFRPEQARFDAAATSLRDNCRSWRPDDATRRRVVESLNAARGTR